MLLTARGPEATSRSHPTCSCSLMGNYEMVCIMMINEDGLWIQMPGFQFFLFNSQIQETLKIKSRFKIHFTAEAHLTSCEATSR